jgi:hypothetical protein
MPVDAAAAGLGRRWLDAYETYWNERLDALEQALSTRDETRPQQED